MLAVLFVAPPGVQWGWNVICPLVGQASSPVCGSIAGISAASIVRGDVSVGMASNHQAVPARIRSSASMMCESQ